MGFRCPNCHKDFGFDREALDRHIEENADCNLEVYLIREIESINNGLKEPKIRYGNRGRQEAEVNHRHIEYISPNHKWTKVNLVTNEDGSDDVICTRCGLKAKRFGSSFKFDMRYTRKIQHCCD